jgi:hypothetical protein
MFHTGPRVEGSHHTGDWILRLIDRFLDWHADRFGSPPPSRLLIG